jgi:hypothetical protein
MSWIAESVKRGAVSAVVSVLVQPLVAGPALTILLILGQAWARVMRVPPWLQLAIASLVGCLFIWYLVVFLRRQRSPDYESRYWGFYKAPFWRISWAFDNYLGIVGGAGRPSVAHQFQARVRFNLMAGSLDEAYITSVDTGERIDLRFDPGDANGNPDAYVLASKIKTFSAGTWVRALAPFQSLSEQELLSRFGHFRLTFKVTDRLRKHINFSRAENAIYFVRWDVMVRKMQVTVLPLH